MNNKLLTVVSEGGRIFGFGHITRCLSISSVFKHYGYEINFIVNADDSISSVLTEIDYTILNWTQEQQTLLNRLEDSSFILIDSMQITNEQILNIQALEKNVIFIDDEKRRNILEKGFVVDWTVLSDEKEYFIPRKEHVTYLLGSNYTPLREEFTGAKQNSIKQNIESIMLTFGGSDVRNLTPIILKTLVDHFPAITKNIIIGPGFTNIKKIEFHKDNNTNLIFNANASTMVHLMQNNDLAIVGGGQTLHELARIGTPTIAILLVDNAKEDTEGWDKVGTLINIGWYNNEKLLDNLITSILFLKNKNKRLKMQNKAKKYINPNGAFTLVDSILNNAK